MPISWSNPMVGGDNNVWGGELNTLHNVFGNAINNLRLVSVRDYGAVGNGKYVVDGAMTSSSATLTSSTAGFTSGDVGKILYVAGAGAAGAQLSTTISAFTNSTTVTLAASASTTVTNAMVRWWTDDSSAVTAALSALGSAPGVLYLPAGSYLGGKITLNTGQWLLGPGTEAVIYTLKSGVNDNALESTNFASLTGTDTTATPYSMGIVGVTIDANKGGQTGTSNGVAVYAYGYRIDRAVIRNARTWGLWTEWGSASLPPAAGDSMEAFITNFKIHDCSVGGIRNKGPHDSQFVNGVVYYCGTGGNGHGAIECPTDLFGSGSLFSLIHVWGGTHDYGFYTTCSGVAVADSQIEGSLLAEVRISQNNCFLQDVKVFAGGVNPNTVKGVLIDNTSFSLFARVKCENMGGGVLDVTSSGGDHDITIFADYYGGSTVPSPAVVGTLDGNSKLVLLHINASGVSSADSTLTFPGLIKTGGFQAAGAYASGVGINTTPSGSNALAIEPGADGNRGLVIFPHSSSQSANLLGVQNASFADVFTVDKAGNVVAAGSLTLSGIASNTSASAGGASALPATPQGYITVTINGTARKIPYYPT